MGKRIGVLYFSPTGTTKKTCHAVALGMGEKDPQVLDLTLPDVRARITAGDRTLTAAADHFIVGAPVYFGKLPAQFMDCLGRMEGRGKESTAVVVYGNRDYGIALRRLVEILAGNGFAVVAAGAFIGQHSYKDVVPVAIGRPDEADLKKAVRFGEKALHACKYLSFEDIPTQTDIFTRSDTYMPLKPTFISELCVQCGICADCCPQGILSPETGTYLSRPAKKQCIGCMACVSICASRARVARPNAMLRLSMKMILKKAAKVRQEPLTVFAEH